jgi:hypothetical protein
MDPTVMCVVYTQTEETRMDGSGGGAAAAKQVYERQPEMNTQKIRELEEELVVSERFTADLMLNISSVEQQARKYAEAPAIMWTDDCECRQNFSAVADSLKKFIITEKDAKKSKQETRDTKKSKPEAGDTKKSKPDATSGRTTKVYHENQTEPNSR